MKKLWVLHAKHEGYVMGVYDTLEQATEELEKEAGSSGVNLSFISEIILNAPWKGEE